MYNNAMSVFLSFFRTGIGLYLAKISSQSFYFIYPMPYYTMHFPYVALAIKTDANDFFLSELNTLEVKVKCYALVFLSENVFDLVVLNHL